MTKMELIEELPKALLNWYPFQPDDRVLYIKSDKEAWQEEIQSKVSFVDVIKMDDWELFVKTNRNKYDFIVAIHILERIYEKKIFINNAYTLLKETGKLLLGVDNRLGIRFFCGDRDPYTERNFDSIENYRRVSYLNHSEFKGMLLSKNEVLSLLEEAGFKKNQFYSVMPNLEMPQLIYAQDYLPRENLSVRYFPMYHYPEVVFLEEEHLYASLIENDLFHQMANSYLFECKKQDSIINVKHVTASMSRGREHAMLTIIRRDNKVEKKAVYKEGKDKIEKLIKHSKDLKEHGISVVDAYIEDDSYIMPFIENEIAIDYLQCLMREDSEKFIREMDRFYDLILKSSDHVPEEELTEEQKDKKMGIFLKRGYFDLVPLNCFFIEGEFVFFDQEFCFENYPANILIYRAVSLLYWGMPDLEKKYPMIKMCERYGLIPKMEDWRSGSAKVITKLRNEDLLRVFKERYQPNYEMIHSNRQKMNFSASAYKRTFIDIFDKLESKKLVLFGSGAFAKKFIALYGNNYKVSMILDNSSDKWGTKFREYPIISPKEFIDLDINKYKVIICIKNYMSVLLQLQKKGVKNIAVYDTNIDYNIREPKILQKKEKEKNKKYHTGYIAGVFDLFHIGHLNMLKRAKGECEYLIVGVVSDEGVRKKENKKLFIPVEERMEIIRSCRYVDKVVEIPFGYGSTRDAWRLYHFDCQFSGSDYLDDSNWLADKEFLEKNGADMVFFPYTEQTNSTKIKSLIESKLI